VLELELQAFRIEGRGAEGEEFYLIQRSFKVIGQKKLNSAAAVLCFLPFKKKKEKKK
jgi:hypothetical protein